MTIVPVQILEAGDLPHLGDDIIEAIKNDHEDMEHGIKKDLDCLEEPEEEDPDNPSDTDI